LNDQSLLTLKICYLKHQILYTKLIFQVSISANTVLRVNRWTYNINSIKPTYIDFHLRNMIV